MERPLSTLLAFTFFTAALAGPAQNLPGSPLSTTPWVFVGPQPVAMSPGATPYSGRATAIALDPRDWHTAYLGTTGGIWKTTNAGQSWTALTDKVESPIIGALAVAPSNPAVIYAGTGENAFSVDSYESGSGVLKSVDSGATWTVEPLIPTLPGYTDSVYSVAVDPRDSNLVLAGSTEALWRSTDGGASWKQVLFHPITALLIDRNNPNTIYAGINGVYTRGVYSSAVYKSTDKGLTWKALMGTAGHALPSSSVVVRTALAQDTTGQTLYVGLARSDYSAPGYLYKTSDGGASFTELNVLKEPGTLDWYSDALAVVPGSNVLYSAGFALGQSLDGGQTWAGINDPQLYFHQKAFAISPDGAAMYVTNEGGVFLTENPSSPKVNFTSLNEKIGSMTFSPGFAILSDHKTIFAATYGHATEIGPDSTSNGLGWHYADNFSICDEGGSVFVDRSQHYAYAHCADGKAEWMVNPNGPLSATTWKPAQTGIDLSEPYGFVVDIEGDPSNEAIVYTATNRLYQSTDHASSWKAISPPLTQEGGATIKSIAVSPTNPNVVYTGGDDGTLAVTQNALAGAGAVWTIIPKGCPNQPFSGVPSSIIKVVASPSDPSHVFVGCRIPVPGDFQSSLYEFSDYGQTNLQSYSFDPSHHLAGFALDPGQRNTIYAATEEGVVQLRQNSNAIIPLAMNLPHVPVEDVRVDASTRTIFALTHGRGAWSLPLGAAQGLYFFTSDATFGTVYVGNRYSQYFQLENDFVSSSITVTGMTASPNYSISTNCPVLNPGDACTIRVNFTAPTTGSFPGDITVHTDHGDVSASFLAKGVPAP